MLTARGGLETAFQKKLSGARSRYALLPRCADLCQFPTFCYLLGFLLSARLSCQNAKKRGRRSCQNAKMRGRAASDQAVKPPWLTLSIAARPPSRHIALALRSKTSPTFVLAWQRNRSANNGMLLPHHISPPILAPPCSCFASAYRIRLRQRCLIIATRPRPVCSESTVVPLSPLDRIPV